jgi:hypothetical protein
MIDFLKVRIFGNKNVTSGSSAQTEGKSPWQLTAKGIGPYVIGKKLGAGSTAEVFEGLDPTNLDRKVAIKVLLGPPERTRKCAIQEAKIMSCIRHENIAGLIGLTQVGSSIRAPLSDFHETRRVDKKLFYRPDCIFFLATRSSAIRMPS